MIAILIVIILVGVMILPHLWIRHVLKTHGEDSPEIPGTGGELARHLIERFQIEGVVVETTASGQDHYDPDAKAVRLSPEFYNGKSLSAIAVATHEVGHAIQYHRSETITHLRVKYTPTAMKIERFAVVLLMAIPLVTAIVRIPQAALIMAVCGVTMMLAAALLQALILPMEWDASFNKALPILKSGEYIKSDQEKAVKQVLRAAALTYVASALIDLLRLWRWMAILRGIIR